MTTTITPAAGQNVGLLQLGPGATGYGAIDWRRQIAANELQEGVMVAGAYKVTAGGALNVSIAASTGNGAMVQGDNIASQGLYYVAPHSGAITETNTAAHATLPRIDQVVLEVLDATHDGGASNTVRTRIVDGTATAGATLDNRNGSAALPNNALRLADVLIPAAAGTVLAANIRDRRLWARGAYRLIDRTSASYTTASGTVALIDSTNLNPRFECSGNPMVMTLSAELSHSSASGTINLWPWVDSAQIAGHSNPRLWTAPVASGGIVLLARWTLTPSAGSHLLGWAWSTSGATATLNADATKPLQYEVEELVRPNADNT